MPDLSNTGVELYRCHPHLCVRSMMKQTIKGYKT